MTLDRNRWYGVRHVDGNIRVVRFTGQEDMDSYESKPNVVEVTDIVRALDSERAMVMVRKMLRV